MFEYWGLLSFVSEISQFLQSVHEPYLRASYHDVCKVCGFDWFLVRCSSLPAQLFVVAISDILRIGVGNLTTTGDQSCNPQFQTRFPAMPRDLDSMTSNFSDQQPIFVHYSRLEFI